MSPETPTQERLAQALQRRAEDVPVPDFGPERVRSRAHRIRRTRRAGMAIAACAAVAAVVVPTSVLLQNGDTGAVRPVQPVHSGPPAPSPTAEHSPGRRQTPSPHRAHTSAPVLSALSKVPRGANTFLSYVGADGVVHSDGSTSRLPGTMDPSTQFVAYRDGWLVAGADNRLREYDASGKVVASGLFGGMALTADRTQVAWVMGDKLYQAGLSTMGQAQNPKGVPVPGAQGLLGYLPQGAVIASGADSVRIVQPDGSSKSVPVGMFATATSQSADLVGGLTGSVARSDLGGSVLDLRTGARLWQDSPWRPIRFSDDGRFVAATPAYDNGDPKHIVILNARTGKVVAKTPRLGRDVGLGWDMAWDGHRVVFPAFEAAGKQAVLLALDTSGNLTRVSDIESSSRPGGAYLILSAQP